jgi:G:T/U-mismatch repair DNA glycosylase
LESLREKIKGLWKELDGKNEKHDTELEKFILDPKTSQLQVGKNTLTQLEELYNKLFAEKTKRSQNKHTYPSNVCADALLLELV